MSLEGNMARTNGDQETKRERRRAANRRSAQKSRYRETVMLEELQKHSTEMTTQNSALRSENDTLRDMIANIRRLKREQEEGVTALLRERLSGPPQMHPAHEAASSEGRTSLPHPASNVASLPAASAAGAPDDPSTVIASYQQLFKTLITNMQSATDNGESAMPQLSSFQGQGQSQDLQNADALRVVQTLQRILSSQQEAAGSSTNQMGTSSTIREFQPHQQPPISQSNQ